MLAHLMDSGVASKATEKYQSCQMGESDVRGSEGSGPRPAGLQAIRPSGHQHFMIIIAGQVYNLFLISGGPYHKRRLMMPTSVDKVNVLLHTKVGFIIYHEG